MSRSWQRNPKTGLFATPAFRHTAAIALTSTALVATTLGTSWSPSAAQDDAGDTIGFGALDLSLIDHSIDVAAGGDIIVTYEVTGDLAEAELLFIDQVETDSPAGANADQGNDAESIDPEPAARRLSVEVIVDDRLDETADLISRLGPDAFPAAYAEPIDGILIDDIRPLINIGDDGRVILKLTIGTDVAPSQADRLGLNEAGLYPMLVTLQVDGDNVAHHGTILNRTAPRPSVATVSLAGFVAVPHPTSILADEQLGPLVDDAARIVEFAAVTSMPLTVSIPPPVIDRLMTGTSAGDLVNESLSDDTVQSLPATPFDISSAVAIGRGDAFVNQLTAGEEQLQAALPGVPVRRDVWLVDGPISIDAAALLRSLGIRMLVMPADVAFDTFEPAPDPLPVDRFISIPLPDGTTLPALVLDDAADGFGLGATDAALASGTSTEWAVEYLARLRLGIIDETALDVDPLDGRGRLLTGDGFGPLNPRLLNELVRLDARTSIHTVVDASTFSSTVADAELKPRPTLPDTAGPSLDERVAAIDSTGLIMVNAASMLPRDDNRANNWTRLLETLVSTAYTDDQVATAVEVLVAEADELTSSVIAPEPFTLTLTSREEIIPIPIENTSDEALRVRLELSSQRLAFPEGNPEVVLTPNTTTEIEVPVEAKTNGTTSIELRIVTPLGGQLTEPVQISARVQALSGLAQFASVVLIILLLTWWFNNWRTRRRSNRDSGNDNGLPDAD